MWLLDKLRNKIWIEWNPWFREHIICPYNRRRLKNHDCSILCNNCVGAAIAHDLGLQFNSPFVNLWLYPKDFIRFCENIDFYLNQQLQFLSSNEYHISYPVAKLSDLTIFFMHYHSNEDAKLCWERRKERINRNNIRCLLVEQDGCTKDNLIRFSRLPYPTASFVHVPLPDVNCTHYIRGFEHKDQLGNCIEYKKNGYFGFRYYDDFDYVSFLNNPK